MNSGEASSRTASAGGERKLVAIMCTDIVGFSRQMGVDEARAEAAEVLRLNPKFSLEVHKERAPIKDPGMLERHIAALRKAGLK
jgi:hypothetical protein